MAKPAMQSDARDDGPVLLADELERQIARALEARALWDRQTAEMIEVLPPVSLRSRLEERRRDENEVFRTMRRALRAERNVRLAHDRCERAYDLLLHTKAVRVELVDEPLAEAIRQQYGCAARYVESAVLTGHGGAGVDVWNGVVHTFHVVDHPNAAQAYAWFAHRGERTIRALAVLSVPPVTTARAAVRAATRVSR